MRTCFVIQPFDNGEFDKRFDDTLAPALRDAGLDPYRVDRDPATVIPIEEIEAGIRRADACLADITTHNPNVWFELGYAIALEKPVVLIALDRVDLRFPFDIQHRYVIRYKTRWSQDLKRLQTEIVTRMKAVLERGGQAPPPTGAAAKPTHDLTPHEVAVLTAIGAKGSLTTTLEVERAMKQSGFTTIAAQVALLALEKRKLVTKTVIPSGAFYKLTVYGEQWLIDHHEHLELRHPAG